MGNAKRPFRAPPACLPRKAGSEISETALRFSPRPLSVEQNAHVRSLQGSYPVATDTPRYLDDDDAQQSGEECSRLAKSAASSGCTSCRRGAAGAGLRKSLQGSCGSCDCYPVATLELELPTLRDISPTTQRTGTTTGGPGPSEARLPRGICLVAAAPLDQIFTFSCRNRKRGKCTTAFSGPSSAPRT